jgi:hypothetical protein
VSEEFTFGYNVTPRQAVKRVQNNFILSVHAYNRIQTAPKRFPRVFTLKTDVFFRLVHMYACTDDFHFIPSFILKKGGTQMKNMMIMRRHTGIVRGKTGNTLTKREVPAIA